MIEVENTKHYLINYAPKMILSTKLLIPIHHNKMTLWNVRTERKKNNEECHFDKSRSTLKLMAEGNSNYQLYT